MLGRSAFLALVAYAQTSFAAPQSRISSPADGSSARRRGLWLLVLVAALVIVGSAGAQTAAIPTKPNVYFIAIGTGTTFSATNPLGQKQTLTSDVPVSVTFRPYAGSLVIGINAVAASGSIAARLILSGLAPSTTYNLRQDGVPIASAFSSPQGQIVFSQDISRPHGLVWSSLHDTTYILADGTVSPSTAPIAVSGSTYTLTANLAGALVVQKDSVTINGNSFAVIGSSQATGMDLSGRTGVTVKNILVKGFGAGVLFSATANSGVINSTATGNTDGILLSLPSALGSCLLPPGSAGIGEQGSCNLIEGNYISGNAAGSLPGFPAGAQIDGESLGDQFLNNVIGSPGPAPSVGSIGVLLFGVGVLFQGNRLSNNSFDLALGGRYNTISGNTISVSMFGEFAYDLSGSFNVLSSNTFIGNGTGAGIEFECGAANNTIEANSFLTQNRDIFDAGLFCRVPPSGNIVSKNQFQGASFAGGIFLEATGDPLISQNSFVNAGILATNSSGLILSSNTFNAGGISLRDSQSFQIVSSTFQNAATAVTLSNSQNVLISGENFNGNGTAISLSGNDSGSLIVGNLIGSSTVAGIVLSAASGITITSNNLQANQTAISLSGNDSGSLIVGNLIGSSTVAGIVLSAASGITITSNTLNGNGTAISLSGNDSGSLIVGNLIGSSTVAGIVLSAASGITITSNTLQANQTGINVSGSSGGNAIYHNNFITNSTQALVTTLLANTWNLSFPDGGNFWSDFTTPDAFSGAGQNLRFSDGIVDVPRHLAPNNDDQYPFVSANGWLSENRTPPGPITDLAARMAGLFSVTLQWTASGDHGSVGTARNYLLRYSSATSLFALMTPVANLPLPLAPGTLSTFTVTGLAPATTYLFALAAQDEFDDIGAVSNLAQTATLPDTMPPAPVTDLMARYGSLQVLCSACSPPQISTAPANSDILLTWSTPADDVQTTGFQLYRSTVAGQLGVFLSTVTLSTLDPGVVAFLGGKDYFSDPGRPLPHGLTVFYTALPFDAAGNVNISSSNLQTSGITVDHVPPALTTSSMTFLTEAVYDSLAKNYQVPRRFVGETSYDLTFSTDDGASGGFTAQVLVGTVTYTLSGTTFSINSSFPGLASVESGFSKTGRIVYFVTDRAGNTAYDTLRPTIFWDGLPPAVSLSARPNPATAAGQVVSLTVHPFEQLSTPPTVEMRQSGSTSSVSVAVSSTPPSSLFFSGNYTVLPGLDGSVLATVTATDLAGNQRILTRFKAFVVNTGQVLSNAQASPGDPFPLRNGSSSISIDVGSPAVDVQLAISSAGAAVPLSTAAFLNASNTTLYDLWNVTDNLGNPQPDGIYTFTFTAFQPGTSIQVGQPQNGFIKVARNVSFSFSSVIPQSRVFIQPVVAPDALSFAAAQAQTVLSAIYDLSPDGLTFSPPATLTICPGTGPGFPKSATISSFTSSGWSPLPSSLASGCLTTTISRIGGLYAVLAPAPKNIDTTPPVTTLQLVGGVQFVDPAGNLYASSSTAYRLTAVDPLVHGFASGVAFTQYRVDAGSSTPFILYQSTFALSEGAHMIEFRSQDRAGNLEATKSFSVRVDATPPISSLAIGRPQVALSSAAVLVSSVTPFAISAVDPLSQGVASGVHASFFSVDGGTFSVFTSSFTLSPPDGPRTIAFYSQDNVLNTEVIKSSAVILDSTPPVAVLLSPTSSAGGVCSVFSGKFPVIGTVADLHFQGYVLDFAPGANASLGFTLIAASTVAVSSGTLGIWNTAGLSGFQTLRLTATDLVDNVTVTTVTVFVGSPALLLSLQGRHGFNKPAGVAVDAANRIYVADTNNDQVDVFTSTGGFVTILGRGRGQDGDKDDRTQGRLRLNKPKDVKVDAAGDVFIADTNNNRVVKVSLSGQLLLQIGRQQGEERKDHDDDQDGQEMTQPGHGDGQFNKPSAVALDASGRIFVSDTNNHRVQIFDAAGSFLSAFNLPAVAAPAQPEADDDDDPNDLDSTSLGRPFGIGLDAAGNIYVADARGNRALKFSFQGGLLASVGTPGSGPGQFNRPEGIAVSPDGGCLFVSDRNNDRVQRFDLLGDVALVFGSAAAFNKPVGLALDGAGSLYIADRNDNRIEKFGLPTGVPAPPVIVDVSAVTHGLVRARGGGRLERGDGVRVDVPDGALSQDMLLSIEPEDQSDPGTSALKSQRLLQHRMVQVSSGVDYGPEGTVFSKPVTITLAYNPGDLRAGQDPAALGVYYWNPQTGDWEALPSVVNASSLTVSAQTMHFSLYRILGSLPDPNAKAASDLGSVQMACNPLRPAIGCEPMRFKNLPAGASLRIFTFSGALVKNISADGTGQAAWDGTNSSGSPAASGVYFVYVQGAGQSKVLKVAVQR